LPLVARQRVLHGRHDLCGVAHWLQTALESGGVPPKVVVLAGAGISTSCGIPDFRSPNSGLYADAGFKNAFHLDALLERPAQFYEQMRQVFQSVAAGAVTPSPTHYFFELLRRKGLLQRVYTQNIDGLELAAGLPPEFVVEAHGSVRSAHCVKCGTSADQHEFWRELAKPDGVPCCKRCTEGVLRPDVVFFGEPLPARFNAERKRDLDSAELLVILGSTLSVHPFAGLVNEVGPLCPRLLINRELRGPFSKLAGSMKARGEGAAETSLAETCAYRDAAFVGDCDAGVVQLCRLLGWEDELARMCNSGRV